MNESSCLNVEEHKIKIIKSARRSISLRIDNNRNISILCPYEADIKHISQFVRTKQNWIDKALAKIENKIDLISLDGQEKYLLLNGERIPLKIEHSDEKVKYKFEQGVLTLFPRTDSKIELLNLVLHFLGGRLDYLQDMFTKYGRLITPKRPIHKISWKLMKSRWGSYSSKHNISLNIALVMLPKEIQELVIVHELCHIQEPNHSRNFYEHLGEYLPNHRELDKELNKYNLSSIYNCIRIQS